MKKFYMIDLDGTMFKGTEMIESAKVWLDHCIENELPFLFLTNNSSRTQAQACEHMLRIGYENIKPEHFYTAALAAVDTIADQYPLRKAFYVGMDGLKDALINHGFTIDDQNPDFVFVGLDKTGTYEKYSTAIQCVLNGAILVGTNNDRILISENGANVGNGSIVAMMEYCTSREAVKIGKPYLPILECACKYAGVAPDEVTIIGDNLETDILCGINGHCDTILVTTGVHTKEDCDRLNIHPTQIVSSLKELI